MSKKIFFLVIFFFTVARFKAQTETIVFDTISIEQLDSFNFEEAKKVKFGEKVNKLLGWGNDDEVERLQRQIQKQKQIIDSISMMASKTRIVIRNVPNLSVEDVMSIKKDESFISSLPESYSNLDRLEIEEITREIDLKIYDLLRQRDSLVGSNANKEIIEAKSNIIESLIREKQVIRLSGESDQLKQENTNLTGQNSSLKEQETKLRRLLYITVGISFVLALLIFIYIQRKKIKGQDEAIENQLKDINKKNTYLEHAAKIIRHDMHSGINTYLPRGISALEKNISDEEAKRLKIFNGIKMLKDGLAHTQKVYKSVYEFTNLVKQNVVLNKEVCDLKEILELYFSNTSYKASVEIEDLKELEVNQTLFCNAIDNLVRNGLKYNDSERKFVRIYMEGETLVVQDNGRGMTQKQFEDFCHSYSKKSKSDEVPGLGLNICLAILNEHGFVMTCEKNKIGTKIKINI